MIDAVKRRVRLTFGGPCNKIVSALLKNYKKKVYAFWFKF